MMGGKGEFPPVGGSKGPEPLASPNVLQCAVERRLLLAGANPAQQLSLRLVAARADHGGNEMV